MLSHTLPDHALAARASNGRTLRELSDQHPTLVVFLRFSGCPFCLEAMDDIKRSRPGLDRADTQVVFVHMMSEEQARPFFEANGVGDVPRISDPDQALYRAFGLRKGNLWQIMGPFVWLRVLRAGRIGTRVGKAVGDMWQMPGVFLLDQGRVLVEYRHRSQASRPDYQGIACSRPLST